MQDAREASGQVTQQPMLASEGGTDGGRINWLYPEI
jgi:hypothetical protein